MPCFPHRRVERSQSGVTILHHVHGLGFGDLVCSPGMAVVSLPEGVTERTFHEHPFIVDESITNKPWSNDQ